VDARRPWRHRPIVAVPTTAGTGSEVGRASVITNSQTHVKKIIFHPKVLPSVVICRPGTDRRHAEDYGRHRHGCVRPLPRGLFVPFFHPMSQGIALEGMRLVKENLPRAYADGTDIEARAAR
jgi:alcohol dehydrogenase